MTTLDQPAARAGSNDEAPAVGSASPRWLLPVEAYTSEAWFEQEQALLFGRCWGFAGMADDLPGSGDYLTTKIGNDPIVVIRHPDGSLRAFHNLCRHRGVQLLEGRGNVSRGISCFYHRWRYDLGGALTTVPQPDQFPDLCKDDLGLHPAAVGEWNGMVFVHTDPAPPEALEEWLGDFRHRLGPFEPLGLEEVSIVRHTLEANWKLFLENHVDGYHLWHLHATSIKGLDHRHQQWQPAGRHWTFYEPPSVPGAHADAALTGLPILPTHGDGGFGSSVHLVFPNLGVAGGSTFWATLHAIPVSAERTTIEIRTRIAPLSTTDKTRAAVQIATRSARKKLRGSPLGPILRRANLIDGAAADGGDFVAEDLRAAEAIQHAIRSDRFSIGPMAHDYEAAITFFQRNILDYLEASPAGVGEPEGETR